MGISPTGWLDWAIRLEGRPPVGDGFNPGINPVKGLVFHSAEGWAGTMLSKTSQWGYYSAQYPWHLSNLLDGRLFQHYSLNVRCWHGSAFNQEYVGMENEGVSPEPGKGPLLNDAQVANSRHVIADLAAWKGWTPHRPVQSGDRMATLYEHREAVWFPGGTSTSCPNNRIPWDKILAASPVEEDEMKAWYSWASWFDNREIGAGGEIYVAQVRSDFSLPPGAKACLLQPVMASGSTEWFHGGSDVPGVKLENAYLVLLDEKGTANFRVTQTCKFRRLQCVGYYT